MCVYTYMHTYVLLCTFFPNVYKHMNVYTVYPEILSVIKFGNLPKIWQKCIIGGI